MRHKIRSSGIATLLGLVILLSTLVSGPLLALDPFNQDPGTGGGSGQAYCWTQSCAFCGTDCNAAVCWNTCYYDEWNGGCACWFEDGECSPNGSCTYVE